MMLYSASLPVLTDEELDEQLFLHSALRFVSRGVGIQSVDWTLKIVRKGYYCPICRSRWSAARAAYGFPQTAEAVNDDWNGFRPGAPASECAISASELPRVRSDFLSWRGCPGISRIRCSCRLYQQKARFLLGAGLVLNATRHDEQLPWTENHRAIA